MKRFIIKMISEFTILACKLRYRVRTANSIFFRVRIRCNHISNMLAFSNSVVKRSSIIVNGNNNNVDIRGLLSDSKITIFGSNNNLIIDLSCSINQSTLIIRGDNCTIRIGKHTTFGGVYMVCMGSANYINIGDECMFAENIDIWNSDSHPIIDVKGEIINPSKPIQIGNYIWVGKDCKILKGVEIGDNSIIGMGSIVTKNIMPKTLNVGIPAKCIKTNISWNRNFIKI